MDRIHASGADGGGFCFVHEGQDRGTPSSQRAIEREAGFSVEFILAIVSKEKGDALKYQVAVEQSGYGVVWNFVDEILIWEYGKGMHRIGEK